MCESVAAQAPVEVVFYVGAECQCLGPRSKVFRFEHTHYSEFIRVAMEVDGEQ
jgi:hypothetical protein